MSRLRLPGRLRLPALFVVSALAFGTAFVGIKSGLATVPPLLFAALRFDIGAVLLLAYVAVRYDRWRPRSRGDLQGVLVVGTFLLWINGAFLFVGQQFVTTAAAAVIYASLPILTPLFALVLLPDERLSRLGSVGIALGFLGVAIIVQPDPANLLGGSGFGQAFVFVSALSVAFGSTLLRRVRPDLESLPLTAWAMVLGAAGNHVSSLAIGESQAVPWTASAVLAVVYVGVFSTSVAFPAYFTLIREAGAIRANLISYVVPVIAAVTGALVLGERFAATTAVGFVVIVAGFVLLEFETIRADLRRLFERLDGTDARDRTDTGGRPTAESDPEHAETERTAREPTRSDGGNRR